MTIRVETNLLHGLRHTLSQFLSAGPLRRDSRKRTAVAILSEPVEPAPPLPPCQPLNPAERDEVETLARLRHALYSKDA